VTTGPLTPAIVFHLEALMRTFIKHRFVVLAAAIVIAPTFPPQRSLQPPRRIIRTLRVWLAS